MKLIDVTGDLELLLNEKFEGLHSGGGRSDISGGQSAANRALSSLNVKGYATSRSQVQPINTRGATQLSPYIRHNLITLEQAWQAVKAAPYADKEKFQDELMWQEYTRHLYARIGTRLFHNLRFEQNWNNPGDGWPKGMACVDSVVDELELRGWIVNQSRMWLASQWNVRNDVGWLLGQERMYQNLIDGSRAANLAGWQWTVGSVTGKPYGFARWQVENRAPGTCGRCALKKACPIQEFKDLAPLDEVEADSLLAADLDLASTTGPLLPLVTGVPESVLLTIDSLGDHDPALRAHPELPAVFIFNEFALRKLQLSSKRIYFYLETLQDLSTRRDVRVFIGDPYQYAENHEVAITYAPVPSFNKFKKLAITYPYPWLKLPHAGSVKSFSAWRNFYNLPKKSGSSSGGKIRGF